MKIIPKRKKTYKYLCDNLLDINGLLNIHLDKIKRRNFVYTIYSNSEFWLKLEKGFNEK